MGDAEIDWIGSQISRMTSSRSLSRTFAKDPRWADAGTALKDPETKFTPAVGFDLKDPAVARYCPQASASQGFSKTPKNSRASRQYLLIHPHL